MMSRGQQVQAIRHAVQRQLLALDARHGALAEALELNVTELVALRRLLQASSVTPTQLGSWLRLSSGGTTALVQRLEDRGWIHRTPHATDGRSVVLRLTPHGHDRLKSAIASMDTAIDAATNGLSPAEQAAVHGWLNRVARMLERHAEEPSATGGRSRRTGRSLGPPCLWS